MAKEDFASDEDRYRTLINKSYNVQYIKYNLRETLRYLLNQNCFVTFYQLKKSTTHLFLYKERKKG